MEFNDLMSIEETIDYLHGVYDRQALAQLRFRGTGPRYVKPSERKVLYRRAWIDEWLESNIRTMTGVAA